MRRMSLIALLTGLVTTLAVPIPAVGQEALPVVTGTTRIVAEGTRGVVLNLPAGVEHTRHSYQATISGGSFALVRVVPETCSNLDIQGSCLSYRAILLPKSTAWPQDEYLQYDTVPAGRLEVYIVTDGTVTFDMTFPELPGASELTAAAPIDARFETLPRQCPEWAGDCANIGYGGMTHSVGDSGGVAMSIAYAETEQQDSGTISVQGCVSPGPRDPAGSSDPAAHSEGCEFGATAPGQDYLVNYAVGTQSRAKGFMSIETNPGARGPIYAGYRAHHINPAFPNGGFAGYGVWITLGIPAP
jgi:hypothetical protein